MSDKYTKADKTGIVIDGLIVGTEKCDVLTAEGLHNLMCWFCLDTEQFPFYFIPDPNGSYSFELERLLEDVLSEIELPATYDKAIKGKLIEKDWQQSQLSQSFNEWISDKIFDLTKLKIEVVKADPYYGIKLEGLASSSHGLPYEALNKAKYLSNKLKAQEQRICTIGYEGLSIDQFISILVKHDIQLVCDVRANPVSRKPGYSKTKLGTYLKHAEIEYHHIPELGISSKERQNLDTPEQRKTLFDKYQTQLKKKETHLDTLMGLAQLYNRIALMCFEHHPDDCHRTEIGKYLSKTRKHKLENSIKDITNIKLSHTDS